MNKAGCGLKAGCRIKAGCGIKAECRLKAGCRIKAECGTRAECEIKAGCGVKAARKTEAADEETERKHKELKSRGARRKEKYNGFCRNVSLSQGRERYGKDGL